MRTSRLVSVALAFADATMAKSWHGAHSEPCRNARIVARTGLWNDINRGMAPGATVAVLDGGDVVYAEDFAMANRDDSVPVDTGTVFSIGSVSKVYVATAAGRLSLPSSTDLKTIRTD